MAKRKLCDGKFVYPDQGAAIKSALHANRLRGVPLRPYDCARCGGWHLTKNPGGRYVATVPPPFTPNDLARIVNRRQETA